MADVGYQQIRVVVAVQVHDLRPYRLTHTTGYFGPIARAAEPDYLFPLRLGNKYLEAAISRQIAGTDAGGGMGSPVGQKGMYGNGRTRGGWGLSEGTGQDSEGQKEEKRQE